jgi:glucosylceramidase
MKKIEFVFYNFYLIFFSLIFMSCKDTNHESVLIQIFESSASGHKLTELNQFISVENPVLLSINPEERYQHIEGIGGSFTEASAHLLNVLGKENRAKILEAYFGDSGARYSLTRTHINSCDFSLSNYSYAPLEGDIELKSFSVKEDMDDLIPMIKDAMAVSSEGFKIVSSPWTAPPWMKDNKDWRGGRLLPEYYSTWAQFFSKYIDAYAELGIDIWAITVENEPLGNDNNWESMHYTPEEMNDFVINHLGPLFESKNYKTKIFGYDQNRDEEMYHWTDVMYGDPLARKYYDGMAVHWYASTFDYFPEALQYAHQKAPEKQIIQSEACVDAQVPVWQDDSWYWSAEATDWGWTWAPEDRKHLHPKYVPVHRYARDIIGCLNNWVSGWIDWNMVLDRQGGPNWFENWCVAPVIVDPEADEVYFTPLYYTMLHFSKFIRPGAVRIGFELAHEELMCTAVENPDGSIAIIIFNPSRNVHSIRMTDGQFSHDFSISDQALQTILINPKN